MGTFVWYYNVRLEDFGNTLPTQEIMTETGRTIDRQVLLTTLNIFMVITGSIRIMYFIRAFISLGWMVELVAQCLSDVVVFGFFFLGIIIFFGTLFVAAGMEEFEETNFVAYYEFWVTTFRLNIGDLPDDFSYPFWKKMADVEENSGKAQTMIVIILTLYVLLIFLMIIVLLNYLIAVISQTYENVMTTKLHTTYLHKAILNYEYAESLGQIQRSNWSSFILSTNTTDSQNEDEWLGFINTIKQYIQHHNLETRRKMNNLRTKRNRDLEKMLDK